MFKEFIDKSKQLESYSNYSEYSNDPNYEFEKFALNHSFQITGEIRLSPHLPENIDEWIAYIEERALTSCNPTARARYNDLIWSYKKQYKKSVLKSGNVREKCELAISDYIYLAEKYILLRVDDKSLLSCLKNYLYRAWNLSKQIKSPKQQELVQLMIEIENSIDENTKIGLWGFSYEKLIADHSIFLSLEQEKAIINKIELRIQQLNNHDYFALEYGIKILLEYYKDDKSKQGEHLDLIEKNAHIKSEHPFDNQNRFKRMIELCHKYEFKERKERAVLNYQLYGADIGKHMVKFEREIEITPEMQQELINLLFDSEPKKHFLKIAQYFISPKSRIKETNEKSSSNFFSRTFFRLLLLTKMV